MKPLDLNEISWNNFFVSGVFFIVNLILFTILVPLLIAAYDDWKWSPAREKICERSIKYNDRIDFYFSQFSDSVSGIHDALPEAMKDNPEAYTKEGVMRQKNVVFYQFEKELTKLDKRTDKALSEYLQEIQLLTPALNSDLAIRSVEFYESIIRPQSLALATFNWWVLAGKNDPTKIGVNRTNEKLYQESELALDNLCKAAGVKTIRLDSRVAISTKKAADTKELSKSPKIFQTMEKLATILTKPVAEQERSKVLKGE